MQVSTRRRLSLQIASLSFSTTSTSSSRIIYSPGAAVQPHLVSYVRSSWLFLTLTSRYYRSGSAVASSTTRIKSSSSRSTPSCSMRRMQRHGNSGRKPSNSARSTYASSRIVSLEWVPMVSSLSRTRSKSRFQSSCVSTFNRFCRSERVSK